MKWLNPLTWSTLALQIVGGVLMFGVLVWYADYKLEKHYTAKKDEAIALATAKKEAAIAVREADNAKIYKEATDAKNKTLEANLADANRVAESRAGLLNSVRAGEERSKTDQATCLQHARAVGELLVTGTDLLGRIAKEADGHVADKVACHDAWPK